MTALALQIRRDVGSALRNRHIQMFILVAMMVAVSVMPAAAQSLTLDVDIADLFTQINNFLPIGFAIFAVPVGIVVAFSLVRFVANALIRAFNGQQL